MSSGYPVPLRRRAAILSSCGEWRQPRLGRHPNGHAVQTGVAIVGDGLGDGVAGEEEVDGLGLARGESIPLVRTGVPA